jgi:hypothetical protein
MSWKRLRLYNAGEHWTIYLLATGSNLFLLIPLYIAARAGIAAQLPVAGSTSQFISTYGITWGLTVDFLWTLLVFQGVLALLVVTMVAVLFLGKRWKLLYILSAMVISGFVGYWLGARFLDTLSWISLLQNSGIDSSGIYSDLFWYGLGATVFYVAMILVMRRSYDKLVETLNLASNI